MERHIRVPGPSGEVKPGEWPPKGLASQGFGSLIRETAPTSRIIVGKPPVPETQFALPLPVFLKRLLDAL